MAPTESSYRRTGLGLAIALGLAAFVTSQHWAWFLIKATLSASLIAYLALNFRRHYANQRITIELAGVREDDIDACTAQIKRAMGPYALVEIEDRQPGDPLRVSLAQSDSVARVLRALHRHGPDSELVAAETTLSFTAMSAQGRASVEVSGVAPPHASVFLPGLREPASAGPDGRFQVELPFPVVHARADGGVLRGEWRKGHARDTLEVRIDAAG